MNTSISKFALGAHAQVDNLSDAMFLAELAAEAEQDAIDDAFFLSELAAEAEQNAVDDAFFLSELAVEAEQNAAKGEPKAEPATSSVTRDDITKIIVQKLKKDRSNNEKIGAILKTYGAAKVSELPAEKYEAFLTDLSQL